MSVRKEYDVEYLQKISDRMGYTKQNKAIEDERCRTDLMYAIFRRPETVLPELLPGLIRLAELKYQTDVSGSGIYNGSKAYMIEYQDMSAQKFFVLTAIWQDEEARSVIKAGYDAKQNKLKGASCIEHFDTFAKHCEEMMNSLTTCPFSDTYSVIQLVHAALVLGEALYLSKGTMTGKAGAMTGKAGHK